MRIFGFIAAVVLLIGAGVIGTLMSFNQFAQIEHAFDGQCTPVRGIVGPEDIQIDSGRSRAFISSLDRRDDAARGAIHIFDLENPLNERTWRDRTNGQPAEFEPFGMDFYDDGDVQRLFVVNQAINGVELYDVAEDGALTHLETFTERRLNSPNSVVAVGRRSFYVTNDVRPGRSSRMGELHFLARVSSGQVFFTDGTIWRVAAEGLRFANGIDLSLDGTRLYVAETAGFRIQLFDRNIETNQLVVADEIKLAAAPDNLTVDERGIVWIAALPKPLTAPAHREIPETLSPSQVIQIGPDGQPKTVYRDNGAELSASTAAASSDQTLLIGGLYDDTFLICGLPRTAF